jgi:hypothetical protein
MRVNYNARVVALRSSGGFLCLNVLLLAAAMAALGLAPKALAAPPFEPNDSVIAATGPLTVDQTFTAAMESVTDRDFFYFYVTSRQASRVNLNLKNLSGGELLSDIDATILDTSSTPLASQTYIRKGEERVLTATLQPQKYYLEITANEGYGDAYSVVPAGDSAIGPYANIASHCQSASALEEHLETRLDRAKGRLQRATGRLRRARYNGPAARKTASAAFRRAKAQVATGRARLKTAAVDQKLWCGIPQ